MIVQAHRPLAARRAAFTLMEVLVVVAIVVILASVGTIGVMRYLEDAKFSQAEQKMMNLVVAEKTFMTQNDGNPITSIYDLVPYLEQGELAITDPWGDIFQVAEVPVQNSYGETEMRIQFYTNKINPKTGDNVRWPR